MASASSQPALSVNLVSKRFGGLVAVDAMSFALAENEVLGLIGPNGSGKTTMMNLISGALKVTSGDIRLYGEAISVLPGNDIAIKGVSRTFQIVRMLPALTVLENIKAGGVFGHSRKWGEELDQHAHDMLHRVGLNVSDDTPITALTYIDQKRVELARALASDPKILLLDEWLAGLNPTELKTGIALIEQLRAEGRTIIVVEHVMHAIRSLCDRCVVMNSGAKIAEGTPQEVLADSEVIRAYLGDADA
jgi:ABC-type branched-subunit amino acid transport system ATPase component